MSVNFQDEAEVKQYLDNIGIEYRFGCYSEKKPDGIQTFHFESLSVIDLNDCEISIFYV